MREISRRKFLQAAGTSLAGSRLASGLGAEARDQLPVNLLFIMTDQQRFDALSCAGNRILDTPNLDRLAQEGVRFSTAVTGCPVCVPARSIILTGNSIETTGVRINEDARRLDVDPGPSFDNILAGMGYQSQYYGKWHTPYVLTETYDNDVIPVNLSSKGGLNMRQYLLGHLDEHVPYRPPRPGELIEPGTNRPYLPSPVDFRYELANSKSLAKTDANRKKPSQSTIYGLLDLPREHTRTALAVNDSIAALDRMKGGPFSLTCSIDPPHPPMVNCKPYYGMYPPDDIPLPENFFDSMENSPYRNRARGMAHYRDPDNIRHMISIYYGMVKEIDDNVGRLLEKLRELGLYQNTLVVFISDHGEMLGSHGMNSKMVFYEESVRVPLLMRLPGVIEPGLVVSDPVSLIDLCPTILDYLGRPGHDCEGRSLRPVIEGKESDRRDHCISEWPQSDTPNFMVRTNRWKLLMASSPSSKAIDALYDLEKDPGEMNNLLGSNPNRNDHRKIVESMKERLIGWLQSVHSPHLEGVKQRSLIS